jgi:hypothetical protein
MFVFNFKASILILNYNSEVAKYEGVERQWGLMERLSALPRKDDLERVRCHYMLYCWLCFTHMSLPPENCIL